MANRIDGTSNGYTFQWKIENITQIWSKLIERIDSPTFIADGLHGTKWFLRVLLLGDDISIFLYREEDCAGPDSVSVHFEVAVLDKDGTHLLERSIANCGFSKGGFRGFFSYVKKEKIFTQREAFFPNDTLTVQCTVMNANFKSCKTEHVCARTIFSLDRNFTGRIKEFSSLEYDKKHTFKDGLIELDLALKKSCLRTGVNNEELFINIDLFDKSIDCLSFKASIVDCEGEKENFLSKKYFEYDLKKGVLPFLLDVKTIKENKSLYLPNDVLTLDFEYVYSRGIASCGCGITSTNESQKVESRNELLIEIAKPETMTAMAKDLISMYNDRTFNDVEIRTSTQTFPAHKNILSARSPVFRKMLSNEMKEKISGYIDIDDLEDDTVHRMLLYMYSDTVADLQYENARKLYLAADKYEIISLRGICASFMKINLCPKKACAVLTLADRHQDDDLKSVVQDFILKHDKEVFGSQEWKDFVGSNSKLAADMMYLFTLSKI